MEPKIKPYAGVSKMKIPQKFWDEWERTRAKLMKSKRDLSKIPIRKER